MVEMKRIILKVERLEMDKPLIFGEITNDTWTELESQSVHIYSEEHADNIVLYLNPL